MINLPIFKLFSENKPDADSAIQPSLHWRPWTELTKDEKGVAFQELINRGWIADYKDTITNTIEYLNRKYLRVLPGKRLHKIPFKREYSGFDNGSDRRDAALADFQEIFMKCENEAIVFEMITKFAQEHIDSMSYGFARDASEVEKRKEYLRSAFSNFDTLTNCFNNIFEQFAVNIVLTRNGLIPRQDETITKQIFKPVLTSLSDPKWETVNKHLSDAIKDYQGGNPDQSIAEAHSAVQNYLQIVVGEEGKNGKGEFGKLFGKAKKDGLIPMNRFTEPILQVLQGYIVSERANKSSAKPKSEEASSADALLVMNTVMVFLQYCQQERE